MVGSSAGYDAEIAVQRLSADDPQTSLPTDPQTAPDTPESPSDADEQYLDAKDITDPVESNPDYSTPDETDRNGSTNSSSFKDLEKGDFCPTFTTPPPAPPNPERFRDISFLGPITLRKVPLSLLPHRSPTCIPQLTLSNLHPLISNMHSSDRLFVLLWVVSSSFLFYYLQDIIWPEYLREADRELWGGWPYVGIIWLVSLPSSIATLIGNLWFRYNTKLDKIPPTTHNVAFRIVSRGTNAECLLETIKRCQQEMSRNPMFPYLIEIVTDGDAFEAPDEPDVIQLKVPSTYQTPGGTLFKARALHYACEHSTVPPNTWIVHLDEETQPTSSGVKGIAAMVEECESTGDIKRIGQGSILYHRAIEKHRFLTLADMRRTGDDFGQFYLQHRLSVTLFGLHGAFIVCRHDMEAKIGFDLGPEGSITEDAWWVLLAMKEGYRTKWVDGYLEEQSTQSIMDLLKQRRRWYYGLSKVITRCPVSLKYRIVLFWSTFTWLIIPVLLPIQLGLMVLLYIFELPVWFPIRILTNFIVSISTLVYFTGLVSNMVEHGIAWWKTPFWSVGMLLVIPLSMALEVIGVVMAFFAPCSSGGKGFHVVQKSAVAEHEESSSSDSSA